MGTFRTIAAAATAFAMLAGAPQAAVAATPTDAAQAENLRKLDIMLMVTSLRGLPKTSFSCTR